MVQGPHFISTVSFWDEGQTFHDFFISWEAGILPVIISDGLAKNKDDALDLFRTAINRSWTYLVNESGDEDISQNDSLATMMDVFMEEDYFSLEIIETTLAECPGIWGEIALSDQRSGTYQITTYSVKATQEALGMGWGPIINRRINNG